MPTRAPPSGGVEAQGRKPNDNEHVRPWLGGAEVYDITRRLLSRLSYDGCPDGDQEKAPNNDALPLVGTPTQHYLNELVHRELGSGDAARDTSWYYQRSSHV
jgi:hypothetical protein